MILLRRRFIPNIGQLWRRACLEYWRPASSRGLYCSFYVIWSVNTQIPGWQPNQSVQSSLFASTEEEFTQFFLYFHFYLHIQIISVSICLLSSGLFITVFICRDIALIQYLYIIIHVIHNFQHFNYLTFHNIYYVD